MHDLVENEEIAILVIGLNRPQHARCRWWRWTARRNVVGQEGEQDAAARHEVAARSAEHPDPALAGQYPCRMCTVHCPMGIAVMEDYALVGAPVVDHPDCTRCGSCIDACPRGTLRLGFRGRRRVALRP